MKDYLKTASIMQCCRMHMPDLRNNSENSLIIYITTQRIGKWVNRYYSFPGQSLN
nr:MAG TPA: hypothetical protein [Caudoviricetes sp.]